MKKLGLFDFNGTLFNDNDLWYASMLEVFKQYGKKPPTVAEFFTAFNGNYAEVYTSRGIEATREELNAIYIPHYIKHMHASGLFPEVIETLAKLKVRGHELGLITAQPEELLLPVLKKFGLEIYFNLELSSIHEHSKKDAIQRAVDVSGVDKKDCFYIGDAPSDTKHGHHAGIKTIAFLNGFMPEQLVLDAKPHHTIGCISELLKIF